MCVCVCVPRYCSPGSFPGGPGASAPLCAASRAPGADLDPFSQGSVAFPAHPFPWLWTSQGRLLGCAPVSPSVSGLPCTSVHVCRCLGRVRGGVDNVSLLTPFPSPLAWLLLSRLWSGASSLVPPPWVDLGLWRRQGLCLLSPTLSPAPSRYSAIMPVLSARWRPAPSPADLGPSPPGAPPLLVQLGFSGVSVERESWSLSLGAP